MILLLIIELAIVSLSVFGVLFWSLVDAQQKNKEKRLIEQLKGWFYLIIVGEAVYDVKQVVSGVTLFHVVVALKQISQRMRGREWELLIDKIGASLIKPQLPKWLKSSRFFKKLVAIQAMEFIQDEALESKLFSFLEDPSPLIRLHAMLRLLERKSEKGLDAAIRAMSKEGALARYPYLEALLASDYETHLMIKKRLQGEKDPQIRACCLEILSQRTGLINISMIQEDLHSPDPSLRWWAIHALERYPSPEALRYLIQGCDDPLSDIQAEACRLLPAFHTPASFHMLENKLSDPCYLVRLTAGRSLKKMGPEGEQILKEAAEEGDPMGSEIARQVRAHD